MCKNSNSQHVTERIVEKTHSLSIYISECYNNANDCRNKEIP